LAEAVRLATVCRADAADVGVPLDEIREVLDEIREVLDEIRDVTDGDSILKIASSLGYGCSLGRDTEIVPEMETLIASEAA
jgi:hypothetical protein